MGITQPLAHFDHPSNVVTSPLDSPILSLGYAFLESWVSSYLDSLTLWFDPLASLFEVPLFCLGGSLECSLLKYCVFSLTDSPACNTVQMPTRPARKIFPSAKLAADNAGELELSTHRRAVASAAAASTAPPPLSLSPLPESLPPPQTDTEDAADPPQIQRSLK